MEVNALKAARKGLRTAFSLSLKKIETELIKENIDMNQLSILKTQFIDKFQRLDTCQSQISEQLLDTKDAVQEYLDDMEDAENYRDRYIEMCTRHCGRRQNAIFIATVEPKSKAERLVLSFPATAENYPKAIDQLKKFGREDLLVQIYVRELLNLVMKNAVSGRTKTDLSALYDELDR
ncbi:DUF1758 domain-containing protein [Trichonephila clavipes]|nr:DUF1758 domain-containing protein [Trichonephila clavipes]